jgi:tripartite ATP-independent transporter DctP family solute receptor
MGGAVALGGVFDVLAACGAAPPSASSSSSGPQMILKFAHVDQVPAITATVVAKFKDIIAKTTNGRITVTDYPNGQLGSEIDSIKQIVAGTLELSIASSNTLPTYFSQWSILDSPYLFTSLDQAAKVLWGSPGRKLAAGLAPAGIHLFNPVTGLPRNVLTTQKWGPISKPADLKGMKARTVASDLYVNLWKAWGANPIPIAFNEIYTAYQTGTIQGSDSGNDNVSLQKLNEVIKYIALTNHIYTANAVVGSEKWWQSLSAADRKIIGDSMQEAIQAGLAHGKSVDAGLVEQLKSLGVTFNEVDKSAFVSATRSVADQVATKAGATDLLAEIRKLAGT